MIFENIPMKVISYNNLPLISITKENNNSKHSVPIPVYNTCTLL